MPDSGSVGLRRAWSYEHSLRARSPAPACAHWGSFFLSQSLVHIMILRSPKHWPHCPSACGIRPYGNSGFLQPSESMRLPIAQTW